MNRGKHRGFIKQIIIYNNKKLFHIILSDGCHYAFVHIHRTCNNQEQSVDLAADNDTSIYSSVITNVFGTNVIVGEAVHAWEQGEYTFALQFCCKSKSVLKNILFKRRKYDLQLCKCSLLNLKQGTFEYKDTIILIF